MRRARRWKLEFATSTVSGKRGFHHIKTKHRTGPGTHLFWAVGTLRGDTIHAALLPTHQSKLIPPRRLKGGIVFCSLDECFRESRGLMQGLLQITPFFVVCIERDMAKGLLRPRQAGGAHLDDKLSFAFAQWPRDHLYDREGHLFLRQLKDSLGP